eukprot:PhF_6_TR12248/c2_g1_i1/m.19397
MTAHCNCTPKLSREPSTLPHRSSPCTKPNARTPWQASPTPRCTPTLFKETNSNAVKPSTPTTLPCSTNLTATLSSSRIAPQPRSSGKRIPLVSAPPHCLLTTETSSCADVKTRTLSGRRLPVPTPRAAVSTSPWD